MTLQNLLEIGQLKEYEATTEEVRALLLAVRRKRNAADYLGSYVDQAATAACIAEAQALLRDVEVWLAEHRADLL